MQNILTFQIGDKEYQVAVKDDGNSFKPGKPIRLSEENTDVVYHQQWYRRGFTAANFLSAPEFAKLKEGIRLSVLNVIKEQPGIHITSEFLLENYHQVIGNTVNHYNVVSKTRNLFEEDFDFPLEQMINRFENILGFKLSDAIPLNGKKLPVIIRINRPGSNDFNPPHKDVYEGIDEAGYIAPFVNIWIPVAGVTENSSLPVVSGSHLLTEDKICRTHEGVVMEGRKYRVRMIREWDGSSRLERAEVGYGQALLFSNHLIHGLAINAEQDTTRVALEFRLFKTV